jgi:gliding motility-associated-like protein
LFDGFDAFQMNSISPILLSVVFFICSSIKLSGQVTADFTAPDTVYAGQQVNVVNLSQNGTSYIWNFCSGNANNNPTGTNIGNPGGILHIPTYLTPVQQNNDHFLFVSCQGTGVIRYFLGGSFGNNPVSWTILGNFGILDYSEEGIQVKNDNGQWYGFVSSNTTLVRLNFGNSLWNSPTAVNLGPFTGLNTLHDLVVLKEGSTWLAFGPCEHGNNLVRFNFGNSLNNIPQLTDLGNLGNLNGPCSIRAVQENNLWYFLVTNETNSLTRISFGTSLQNTPTGQNLGNNGGFNVPVGLTSIRDCETMSGYWANHINPGELGKFNFPDGIAGTVTGEVLGNIGNLNAPHSFSELIRENDTLYTYISNSTPGTLTRLTFLPCTNASIPSSTLFTPPPFSFNQQGEYNVRLTVDLGLLTETSACKHIVVIAGQPVTDFQLPDSACVGQTISITNLTMGGTNYYWNFCSGNAGTDPSALNSGNPQGTLNLPTYITLVKDGTDCFSFTTNQGWPGVSRHYHGASFRNDPSNSVNFGDFGFLTPIRGEGIQVKKDNGIWYGFVTNENKVIRLTFGNTLWNTPSATDLGFINGLDMAHGMEIIKVGNTWIGFVCSAYGNNLVRLNFGTSLANTPTSQNLGDLANFVHPAQLQIIGENNLWYIFIMNQDNNSLSRISFGNSLLNTPTGENLGNVGGLDKPVGITIMQDCNSTTGYFTNWVNNGSIGRLTFNGGLTGPITGSILTYLSVYDQPVCFSEFFRENDSIFSYVTIEGTSSLLRLSFPPCSDASIPFSTLFTPPSFSYSSPGVYHVRLVVDEGLPDEAVVCKSIVVTPGTTVNLGPDQTICPGTSTVLDAGAGYNSYLWSTGATTQKLTIDSAGSYWVKVKNLDCESQDSIKITPCKSPIWFPNAFTPNGDGKNDNFHAVGNGVDHFRLTIFNRWGEKVYETNDFYSPWDGTFRGSTCATGVYYYIATYTLNDSPEEEYTAKGSVTLLR